NASRMAAHRIASGEMRWDLPLSTRQTPWLSGNVLFVIDHQQRLLAIHKDKGEIFWQQQLPAMDAEGERQSWIGPVLAGNHLFVLSRSGLLQWLNPQSGASVGNTQLEGPFTAPPVVAAGK